MKNKSMLLMLGFIMSLGVSVGADEAVPVQKATTVKKTSAAPAKKPESLSEQAEHKKMLSIQKRAEASQEDTLNHPKTAARLRKEANKLEADAAHLESAANGAPPK